jgi:alpha-tubulin suppressor-like RCC1 family protein
MLSFQDFCLFITEKGKLYAMGQNEYGMLGLGKESVNTQNKAHEVNN